MQPVDVHRRVTPRSFSGGTELHWHQAGRERFGLVGPDLATEPWFDLDMAPVRHPSRPPRSEAIAGLYFWNRTGQHVWFESQTEKDVLMWLDFEGDVLDVRSQPFVICFSDEESPLAWHVPDFLLLHPNRDISVVDVRPPERITEKAQTQFDATAAVCERIGFGYCVLDGRRGVAAENVRWLKASRHARCAPALPIEDAILHFARDGISRRALAIAAAPDAPPRANAWIDYLAWHRKLHFALDRPYSSTTVLTTAPTEAGAH